MHRQLLLLLCQLTAHWRASSTTNIPVRHGSGGRLDYDSRRGIRSPAPHSVRNSLCRHIATLTALVADQPVTFRYPWDHPQCECVLLRLAESAGGGIGPDKNIVAFHMLCTHMGAAIPVKDFHGKVGIAGPCPLHLTTFDLTKHGMVVSGHATQGLPQVILELNGRDIFATGDAGIAVWIV